MSPDSPDKDGDLSVTALYTSYAWVWGRLPKAELFETKEARAVFVWTNAALWVMRLFRWSLKSLKHALIHRHVMLDRLVEQAHPGRVLELACGLSRRGVAFAERGVDYVEVDLPSMVAHKRRLLTGTDAGKQAAARSNWRLVAADVREADLDALLDGASAPFVIAEGLVSYFGPEEQRAFWRRIAEALARRGGGALAFDWVPWVEQPRPGWIGRSLEWLMKRFTRGQSFARDERTREDLVAELREAGFHEVEFWEPGQVAREWDLPHPDVPTQQLVWRATVRPAPDGV